MATGKKLPKHYCWVWRKEVSLEDCKTDERGHIVHDYCYILQLHPQAGSSCSTNRGFRSGRKR